MTIPFTTRRRAEELDQAIAQTACSLGDAAGGSDLPAQATRRLDEADSLTGPPAATSADTAQVAPTLSTFSSQAHDGGELLLAAFTSDRDASHVQAVQTFAA